MVGRAGAEGWLTFHFLSPTLPVLHSLLSLKKTDSSFVIHGSSRRDFR
jgi:hypothetical protein